MQKKKRLDRSGCEEKKSDSNYWRQLAKKAKNGEDGRRRIGRQEGKKKLQSQKRSHLHSGKKTGVIGVLRGGWGGPARKNEGGENRGLYSAVTRLVGN